MERLKTWLKKQPKDGLAAIGVGTGLVVLMAVTADKARSEEPKTIDKVRAAVETRFADSEIDAVDCEGYGPLCQVISGRTVLYVDPQVRHAFIGRLYDLDAKRDLTGEALAAFSPSEDSNPAGTPGDETRFLSLPFEAAITRNAGGERKVAVFSDLHCGYCQRLSQALTEAPDIEAKEFLIGWAGSEAASRSIGCTEDPDAAIEEYYQTRVAPDVSCDRDLVAVAREAASRLGVTATPTFVRADGAMMSGFQDLSSLRAWIDAADQGEAQ